MEEDKIKKVEEQMQEWKNENDEKSIPSDVPQDVVDAMIEEHYELLCEIENGR